MGKIIGIDLGTTNSCVSVYENGNWKVIENSEGGRTTPSVVAFADDGEVLVGDAAKRQAVTNPENTLYAIKRLIGRRFDDAETQEMVEDSPFKIVAGDNGDAWVEVSGKKYAPAEVSAKVLQKMKETAEKYLGEDVTEAIVTVPAYFNDAQRQATKDAGKIAGLDVKRIINEPTAACLAYGLDKKDKKGNVLVYDLGGGTFDVSILEIGDGVFEVKSTNGDTFLGGEDFDNTIIDFLADKFKEENGVDLREDKMSLARLKEAAEKAKIELSSSTTTNVNLPFITQNEQGPLHLSVDLSRAKLENLVGGLLQRTIGPVKQALKDANLTKDSIDEIVLVGGMTRMPKVTELVGEFFNGKEPSTGVNPDEVVAAGAATQGAILQGDIDDVLMMDVTSISFGIETSGGIFTRMVEANTTIPTEKEQVFTTHEDNQNSVTVRVYQGEREMAENNHLLGEFHLEDIPPAPKGKPKIAVTFDINADGVLNVTAVDKATGKEKAIRVEADGGLSEEQIEQMRQDAEANKEADMQRREAVEMRNLAEAFAERVEGMLNDQDAEVAAEQRAVTEQSLEALKQALSSEESDTESLKDRFNALDAAAKKYGEAFYDAVGQEQEEGEGEPQNDQDDAVQNTEAQDDDVIAPAPSQSPPKP